MPLFLMGCFPVDFQEVKRPLRTTSAKRPIKVGKRPINKGKRPIKAMVLVGISVGCLMGCFRSPPPWRKTAPLKRPIQRSMIIAEVINQKNPRVLKIRCPQFWGRKWLCQFYGRLEKMRSICRKTYVHKIPRFRGGGVFWVLGRGGGGVPILFLWARGFF